MNGREARAQRDERHICPLQLDVINRALRLWTNPGDTILSPFAGIGSEAASLVPSNAEAFVDVDTHFDSQQWQALADLAGPKLDLARLKAAAGDALSLAVLQDGTPVAFAKTHDEAKLRRLATSFDKGGEHYTVQSISGWSVVADSQQAFAQVKATGSGKSLADNASFRAAEATLNGNSLATAFLNGQELKEFVQA